MRSYQAFNNENYMRELETQKSSTELVKFSTNCIVLKNKKS